MKTSDRGTKYQIQALTTSPGGTLEEEVRFMSFGCQKDAYPTSEETSEIEPIATQAVPSFKTTAVMNSPSVTTKETQERIVSGE